MYNRYEYARRNRNKAPKILVESIKSKEVKTTIEEEKPTEETIETPADVITEEVVEEVIPEVTETSEETPAPRRRGRRKKSDTTEVSPESEASGDESDV